MKKLRDMLYLVKEGVCACSFVQLFVMALMVACQAPLSVGFFRQEYWSGLPFPSPGDLPNPGTEPVSPVSLHCRWVLYLLSHSAVCKFGRLTPFWSQHLQIFSPILWVAFLFCSFLFVNFCFYFHYCMRWIKKDFAVIYVKGSSLSFFL